MKLTEEQQVVVKSLLDIKPRKGKYIILTTNELYRMNDREFIALCKEIIPEEKDLITLFCVHCSCAYQRTSTYMYEMIRKTLRKKIQDTYVTIELRKMKRKYPSFFNTYTLEGIDTYKNSSRFNHNLSNLPVKKEE